MGEMRQISEAAARTGVSRQGQAVAAQVPEVAQSPWGVARGLPSPVC